MIAKYRPNGWIADADCLCWSCIEKLYPEDPNGRRFDGENNEIGPHIGESDCPINCSHCHELLDVPLTTRGILYVLKGCQEALDRTPEERNRIYACYANTAYAGCRHVEIMRAWAELALEQFPSEDIERFLKHFLNHTEI